MLRKILILLISSMVWATSNSYAHCHSDTSPACRCEKKIPQPCCDIEGISYCDTSAGHFVCKSGGYSQCICTRTAISSLQGVSGCCVWHGGVLSDEMGVVVCADGSVSAVCSTQTTLDP